MNRLWGREPVMSVATVVAVLVAVLPVFGWSGEVVGTVSAALVVVGGAVSAALVSVDRVLPLLVGVAKAVLAVVAAFGLHVPDNYVAALMAVLTVVAGLATRAQVGAVEPPRDRDGGIVAVRGILDERPIQLRTDLTDADAAEFVSRWRAAERAEQDTPPPSAGPQEPRTEVLPTAAVRGADGGEGERGGEGRHAARGWVSGRLLPDHGV